MSQFLEVKNANGKFIRIENPDSNMSDVTVDGSDIAKNSDLVSGLSDKITLAEANAHDLGVGQTWQNVIASRALGVTYTNITGKPIFDAISLSNTSSTVFGYFYIDGVRRVISRYDSAAGIPVVQSATFIVPNGSTYMAQNNGETISEWHELR